MKGVLHKIAEDLGVPDGPTPLGTKLFLLEKELDKGDRPFVEEGIKDSISNFETLLKRHAEFDEYLLDKESNL